LNDFIWLRNGRPANGSGHEKYVSADFRRQDLPYPRLSGAVSFRLSFPHQGKRKGAGCSRAVYVFDLQMTAIAPTTIWSTVTRSRSMVTITACRKTKQHGSDPKL
jgi:hypothetical protein